MKIVVGVLLILAGLALGIYAGLVLCFVGGILQIVDGATAHPVSGSDIAWGAVRALVLPEIVGGIAFLLLGAPGIALIGSRKKYMGRLPYRSRSY